MTETKKETHSAAVHSDSRMFTLNGKTRGGGAALSLEVSFEYLDALDMIYTPAWLLTAQWFLLHFHVSQTPICRI